MPKVTPKKKVAPKPKRTLVLPTVKAALKALGLKGNATIADAKKAQRALANKAHPDMVAKKKAGASKKKDFLDEVVADRTKKNPHFPALVDAAAKKVAAKAVAKKVAVSAAAETDESSYDRVWASEANAPTVAKKIADSYPQGTVIAVDPSSPLSIEPGTYAVGIDKKGFKVLKGPVKTAAKSSAGKAKAGAKEVTKTAAKDFPTKTPKQVKFALKRIVRMFYDLQKLRMQVAGRTAKHGEENEVMLHPTDLELLESRAKELHEAEKQVLDDVLDCLKQIPFYRDVLSDKVRYKGIGPTMAAVILSEFDIEKEDTPSKMWAFAGLAPIDCYRCKACQSVLKEITDSSWEHKPIDVKGCKIKGTLGTANVFKSGTTMRPVKGEKLPYNKFLRSKLCGVLGPVMLKVKSPWTKIYYDYKHRKETAGWGKSDGHRHQASIRAMVKTLLLDIWKAWREHEGLPVRPSYHEQKQMGHGYTGSGPGRSPSEDFIKRKPQDERKPQHKTPTAPVVHAAADLEDRSDEFFAEIEAEMENMLP